MGDATRPGGESVEELAAARAAAAGLVGELTHLVLGLFREGGLVVSERITLAGGDPFEVIDVFVETLRALADGLATPDPEWRS